jgi:TolB-like protein/DNA-binding winged helix-turn-helix (wHTH) protein/Tfp pilus assembly protein PilF
MIYRFGDCVLDSQLCELTVGGMPVHVEPQVFDVMRFLLEKRDCVVSRDELINAVWQGRSVSDATVAARIWAARQAIGDTGEAQNMIATVRRRGFRFVASVTADATRHGEVPQPSDDNPEPLADNRGAVLARTAPPPNTKATFSHRGRRIAAAAAIVLLLVGAGVASWAQFHGARLEAAREERLAFPLPQRPSIAVLPFGNLSSDPAQNLMSEALTESLVNALAKNPSLFVIAHSSVSTYADKPIAATQAAEELGVRYIVEGSVRREGNRARVTVQLVDAIGGQVLWSERYDRAADDLLAVEEEITVRIARSLDLRIVYGTEQSAGGTRSLAAWSAFVEGRTEYLKFTSAGNARAREHYLRAIEIDPSFAQAMVALANTHFIDMFSMPSADWATPLTAISGLDRRAAQIAPQLPGLFELRSMVAMTKGDYSRALADAQAMVELDPNGAESHYVLGRMQFFMGQYERAIDSLSIAGRINPHNRASYSTHLAFAHLALGRTDVAISVLEGVAERWPEFSATPAYLAIVYQLAGRRTEATKQMRLLLHLAPDITMLTIEHRFSPMQDRGLAERIITAARQAGMPESSGEPAESP